MDTIITISRTCGSGGRAVARMLADRFSLPLYDKKVVALAAQSSGLCPEQAERAGQLAPHFWGSPGAGQGWGQGGSLLPDRMFFAQSEIIRQLASQGPCVFVGRCADYVLRERKDVLKVFLHAPLEQRVRRISLRQDCSAEEAEKRIRHDDANRLQYYNHYTRQSWGEASRYHLCIHTGIGISPTAELIVAALAWL